MILLLSLVFVSVSMTASGHPSIHQNFDPAPYRQSGVLPPFQSYHFHVQYLKDGNVSATKAMALRTAYVEHFNFSATPECADLFAETAHCVYPVVIRDGGIFISGNWASFVPLGQYE